MIAPEQNGSFRQIYDVQIRNKLFDLPALYVIFHTWNFEDIIFVIHDQKCWNFNYWFCYVEIFIKGPTKYPFKPNSYQRLTCKQFRQFSRDRHSLYRCALTCMELVVPFGIQILVQGSICCKIFLCEPRGRRNR